MTEEEVAALYIVGAARGLQTAAAESSMGYRHATAAGASTWRSHNSSCNGYSLQHRIRVNDVRAAEISAESHGVELLSSRRRRGGVE